jgi:hypothetical protein
MLKDIQEEKKCSPFLSASTISSADLTILSAREGRVVEHIFCARVALASKRFALLFHARAFLATVHG